MGNHELAALHDVLTNMQHDSSFNFVTAKSRRWMLASTLKLTLWISIV